MNSNLKPQLFVVKIGGNVIDNPDVLKKFLQDLSSVNQKIILIHGGGKIATQIGERLGLEAKMHEGKRITDLPMLEVVTMVYGGLINKNIVAQLNSLNIKALGLTGADGNAILAKKRPVKDIDYGFVGDIEKVNADFLQTLLVANILPVIAPITHDGTGQLLNTNADTIANEVAVAMAEYFEVSLIYCFELMGVMKDVNDKDSLIPQITPQIYIELKKSGAISKGMIPKLDNSLKAINKGVKQVYICHASQIESIGTTKMQGTKIVDRY